MAIIDADGLFGGNRWRRCSNLAQLHWPRLFLASDGFARLELNYHKIIARAYATFNPVPPELELQAYLEEYAQNYLLFVYGSDGQIWGQWDTPTEFLPRYKTAIDRRSPIPPETDFMEWKRRYRLESKSLPKCFTNIPESFLYGKGLVGYGVGKVRENICASDDARLIDSVPARAQKRPLQVTPEQERWFITWWAEYWLHKAKKPARLAFAKHVRTAARFDEVMAATRAQSAEMLTREPQHRPHGATWLNGERWADEITAEARLESTMDPETRRRIQAASKPVAYLDPRSIAG